MAQTPLDADLNIIAQSEIEVQIDPLTKDLNIIQKLDDEPNDVGGLSAQQLKEKFDEAGNLIKDFINDSLIPQCLTEGIVENQRKAAEEQRQANETQRQSAEQLRINAEQLRAEAEQLRIDAEQLRTEAEALRASIFLESQQDREQSFGQEQAVRAEAFGQEQTQQEEAFDAAQEDREARFSSAEAARDVWEDYNAGSAYAPGNKVYFLGSSYVCRAACTGILPTDARYWQMIAKKGADSDEGMSQEEGDLRYLRLTGGAMTGPLTVLEPVSDGHAVPKSYADAVLETAKAYADAGIAAGAGVTSFKGRVGAVTPASGDYTAAQVGAYTQAQCISAATRTMLGLASNATPDAALSELAQYNQYWWRRYPITKANSANTLLIDNFYSGSKTIYYSTTLTFNKEYGRFSIPLADNITLTPSSAVSALNVLTGKYFVTSNNTAANVYYCYGNASKTGSGTSSSPAKFYVMAGIVYLGDASYAQGNSSNNYPDRTISGNYYYESIGKPLELFKEQKSVVIHYRGTGTWGQATPNTLTFPFTPKLVIIKQTASELQFSSDGAFREWTMFVTDTSSSRVFFSNAGGTYTVSFSLSGNTLSWYTNTTTTNYGYAQFNGNGVNYTCIAFG